MDASRRGRRATWGLLAALGLIASSSASAGDVKAPAAPRSSPQAELRVTNVMERPNPGAFTATIGQIPGDRQLFSGGSFEPLVYRCKFRPSADAPDEIVLGADDGRAFGTFRTGFWDGAAVRVYRPYNGKLVRVRGTRVADGGYIAEGWHVVPETRRQLVDPQRTTFEKVIAAHYRPAASYHFCVKAVAKDGRESKPSNAAAVELKRLGERSRGPMNIFTSFRPPPSLPPGPPPPAPQKLQATLIDDRLVSLKWDAPPDAKDLAGYRVYVSDLPPAEHRGFHMRLADKAGGPRTHVRKGDVVFVSGQRNNFSRTRWVHSFRWNWGGYARSAYRLISEFSDEIDNASWQRVPHPTPLPKAFADRGETCLRLDLKDDQPFSLGMYSYGGTDQSWYPVLQAGRQYVAEAWLRYRGKGAGKMRFRLRGHYDRRRAGEGGIEPVEFAAKDAWAHFRTTFKPPFVVKSGGVGRIEFEFTGPGTFWADNLRVYPAEPGYLQPEPLVVQRTRASALEAIRFHTHIKSGWSQTMQMLTNPPGVMGCRGHDRPNSPFTLPGLLGFCKRCRTNPWLQVEMCMAEEEWLGLMEYLAAPYDPAADTPAKKPWAYKRYRQGQRRPWTDEFDRVYFEISNETWNWMFSPWVFAQGGVDAATGEVYSRGAMFGLLNEYVLSVLKSSPYWKPAAGRFRCVIGGWAAESRTSGYGAQAIQHSPGTRYLTIAGYNGGWDEGEKPAEPTDPGFFRALTFWLQNEQRTREHLQTRAALVDRGLAHPYEFGTYEAGPGYAMSGLNKQKRMTPEQVEAQDQVGKSLANGVATLDAFLGRAYLGFTLQNFFTLQFKRRHWTSHAPVYKGGQPYPSWMGLSLFNNHGTGDMLMTETLRVPTADLKGYRRRRERKDAPLIGLYATRRGDRVNVFLLSRRLDGYPDAGDDGFTPLTVHLPFKRAKSVTLYKMSGNPRAHNLDTWAVRTVKVDRIPFASPFALTRATTGERRDGLPPGSVFCYVFEGTDAPPLNHKPKIAFDLPRPVVLGRKTTLRNDTADPDGDAVKYEWDLAGQARSDEEHPSFAFDTPGLRTVTLSADDGRGGRAVKSRTFDVLLPVGSREWRFRDLWNAGPAGTAAHDDAGGTLTLKASGQFRRNDFAFAFPPEMRRGDCAARARVVSLTGGDKRRPARAGLMLRSTFGRWGNDGAAVLVDAAGTVTLEYDRRRARGEGKPLSGFAPPCRFRLVRKGQEVTAFVAADADDAKWRQVGTVTLPAAAPAYLGAVVTSGDPKTLAQAGFDRIAVEGK